MPKDAQEIGQELRNLHGPLYCLLEDDRLMVEFKVTTDRLLTPLIDQFEVESHVHLVIHVRTDIVDMVKAMESWEP
jgi:hypothetical protein